MQSWDLTAVPVVVGLVAVAVRTGLPKKYGPLLAVGLGVAHGVLATLVGDAVLTGRLLPGIVTGLSAVGLYSGAKNVGEGARQALDRSRREPGAGVEETSAAPST